MCTADCRLQAAGIEWLVSEHMLHYSLQLFNIAPERGLIQSYKDLGSAETTDQTYLSDGV